MDRQKNQRPMKNKNQLPTLRETKNYSLFESHPHNRDISKTKVLEKSFRTFGFDPGLPIRCVRRADGKLIITHGHHRFHVAVKTGQPVWYIVVDRDISLFESEASSHNWSVRDFTVARARAGERPAEAVLQYHQETGIPLNTCISLLGGESAGSSNKTPQLKNGTFKVSPDTTLANRIKEIVHSCKSHGVRFATNVHFLNALSKCLFLSEFDEEVFMSKVASHSGLMDAQRGYSEYLDLIEFIYNRNSKKKIPLAFLAKENASNRQLGFGKRSA